MKIFNKILLGFASLLCATNFCFGQIQTGVWRTPTGNTDYHHFTRNGGGAAVYINQESTEANRPILRLSSGSAAANSNVRFTVENNGNVGIGTMTPIGKLNVEGTGTIGGKWNPDASFFTVSNGSQMLIMDQNEIYNSNGFYIGSSSGDIVQFTSVSSTSYDVKMIIKEDGNVGIGTTTPHSKLSVNGKIRAHEIKLETSSWPDYVFKEDYKLRSLKEVENYIQQNKHLPDIPSEEEVLEHGIELGKMDASLLQKIEELTLYLIQQQELIEKQQAELASLGKKVEQLEKDRN